MGWVQNNNSTGARISICFPILCIPPWNAVPVGGGLWEAGFQGTFWSAVEGAGRKITLHGQNPLYLQKHRAWIQANMLTLSVFIFMTLAKNCRSVLLCVFLVAFWGSCHYVLRILQIMENSCAIKASSVRVNSRGGGNSNITWKAKALGKGTSTHRRGYLKGKKEDNNEKLHVDLLFRE